MAVPTTDCGSLPMVLWSLLRLAHLDPEAASGIFVTRQSHENESGFGQAVSDAFRLVQIKLCRNSVTLLGASLKDGEAEGGWIEPKPSILGCSGGAVRPVLRLWNRPSPETRHELGQRGCLQNTSMMIGRVDTMLALVRERDPELLLAFERAWKEGQGQFPAAACPSADSALMSWAGGWIGCWFCPSAKSGRML